MTLRPHASCSGCGAVMGGEEQENLQIFLEVERMIDI